METYGPQNNVEVGIHVRGDQGSGAPSSPNINRMCGLKEAGWAHHQIASTSQHAIDTGAEKGTVHGMGGAAWGLRKAQVNTVSPHVPN